MDEWKTLEEVDQFKHLVWIAHTREGTSMREVKVRLAQAH